MDSVKRHSPAVLNVCNRCGQRFEGLEVPDLCPSDGSPLLRVAQDPLVGTVLADRYEIEALIDVGGWSRVFKGRDIALNRPVAIKILRSYLAENEAKVRRFAREAKILAKLSHANIVAVHDYAITPYPYIVMDYVDGIALGDYLKQHRALSCSAAISICREICEALAAAHAQGITHRDIKPSNVLMTPGANDTVSPKLLDFGISKLSDFSSDGTVHTETGETIGSPNYMSPEQCLGREIDERSDIYSLGCLMYELISGRQAFAGTGCLEVMHKNVNENPAPVFESAQATASDKVFEKIIFKCLSKDPTDRFQSIAQLTDALERLDGKFPLRAGSTTKRKRLQQCVSAAAVLLIVCGTGAVWYLNAGTKARTVNSLRMLHSWQKQQGDWSGADKTERQVQLLIDPQPPDRLVKLRADGIANMDAGRYKEAEATMLEACRQAEKLGAPNLVQANMLRLLSNCYWQDGQLERAEQCGRESLTINQELLPPDHANIAESLNSLGLVYIYNNKPAQAESVLKTAYSMFEKSEGQNSMHVANVLNNIGLLHWREKRLGLAEEFWVKCLDVRRRIGETDDFNISNCYNNLGVLYDAMNKPQVALGYYQNALRVDRKVMGMNHPHTATTLANCGKLYLKVGKIEDAFRCFEQAAETGFSTTLPRSELVAILKECTAKLKQLGHSQQASALETKLKAKLAM